MVFYKDTSDVIWLDTGDVAWESTLDTIVSIGKSDVVVAGKSISLFFSILPVGKSDVSVSGQSAELLFTLPVGKSSVIASGNGLTLHYTLPVGESNVSLSGSLVKYSVFAKPEWEFEAAGSSDWPVKDDEHKPCGHWHKRRVNYFNAGGEIQSVDVYWNEIVFSFVDFVQNNAVPVGYVLHKDLSSEENEWSLLFSTSLNRGMKNSIAVLREAYHQGEVFIIGDKVLFNWCYEPVSWNYATGEPSNAWKQDVYTYSIVNRELSGTKDLFGSFDPYNNDVVSKNLYGKSLLSLCSDSGDDIWTMGGLKTSTARAVSFTYSEDFGESYPVFSNYYPPGGSTGSHIWQDPMEWFVTDAMDDDILWVWDHDDAFDVTGFGSVYYSNDNGQSWLNVETDFQNLFSDLYVLYYTGASSGLHYWTEVKLDKETTKTYVLVKEEGTVLNPVSDAYYINTYKSGTRGGKLVHQSRAQLWTIAKHPVDRCAFSFSSNDDVLVLLDREKVIRSADGGVTWTTLYSDFLASFGCEIKPPRYMSNYSGYKIDELDFGGCVRNYRNRWVLTHRTLVSSGGYLSFLHSDDDGLTWELVETPVKYEYSKAWVNTIPVVQHGEYVWDFKKISNKW